MKTKVLAFDVRLACQTAWDALWANNLKLRKKDKNTRWANRTYYLTAADIENQVRSYAQNQFDGRPWDTKYIACGRPGQYGWRIRGNLQAMVRAWLFGNSQLTSHNFGRGHISGARFRPVGDPIAPSEQETNARHTKQRAEGYQRTLHYAAHMGGTILCQQARRAKRSYSSGRSRAWDTRDKAKVTCKQCLNLLASYVPPAKRKVMDAAQAAAHDGPVVLRSGGFEAL